ncbi:MAG: glycosyltransferase family 4 protein [Candidatus Diapherotrites archaeon]
MKILLVTPVFPPAIGGIEQHVFNLAKELKAKGIHADVLTTEVGLKKFREKQEINGINIFRVKAGLKDNSDLALKGSMMIWPLTKKLFQLMEKENYDLLHAHCPFTLAACIPAKFFYGIPAITTIHGNWINCIKGRRYFEGRVCTKKDYSNAKRCSRCLNQGTTKIKLKQYILRNLAEQCDALIAVSSDVKNSIKLNKKARIKVIPNVSSKAKDLSKMAARKALKWNEKNKIITFIGSLLEEKGAMVLLKAAKHILDKNNDVELHLIYNFYDIDYLKKIKHYVNKEKILNKVYFHYKVPNKEVRRKFIPASDLIVLPSLWPEPCSTIVTEAMSASIPILASRIGGFKDLIEDKTDGILFKAGNSIELAEKINLLFAHRKKLQKLKKNSKNKFNRLLNWNVVSNNMIKVYNEETKGRENK